jgi:hypothetical protein
VGPLELVKKIVALGAGLVDRTDGASSSAMDATLRAIHRTTTMARHVRAGPLPPARGVERLALMVAAAELRLVASAMGVLGSRPAEAPPEIDPVNTPRATEDFVSPADRALVREEKEAKMRAALGELVVETLALVDEVLAIPPGLGGGPGRGALPPK